MAEPTVCGLYWPLFINFDVTNIDHQQIYGITQCKQGRLSLSECVATFVTLPTQFLDYTTVFLTMLAFTRNISNSSYDFYQTILYNCNIERTKTCCQLFEFYVNFPILYLHACKHGDALLKHRKFFVGNLMFGVQLANVSTRCFGHPQGKSEARCREDD